MGGVCRFPCAERGRRSPLHRAAVPWAMGTPCASCSLGGHPRKATSATYSFFLVLQIIKQARSLSHHHRQCTPAASGSSACRRGPPSPPAQQDGAHILPPVRRTSGGLKDVEKAAQRFCLRHAFTLPKHLRQRAPFHDPHDLSERHVQGQAGQPVPAAAKAARPPDPPARAPMPAGLPSRVHSSVSRAKYAIATPLPGRWHNPPDHRYVPPLRLFYASERRSA